MSYRISTGMKFLCYRTARCLSPRAFTLIELLVVLAVVAVLASLIFAMVPKMLASADQAGATSNLRQFYTAARNYASDNNGKIVPNRFQNSGITNNWRQLLVDSGYVEAPDGKERNAKGLGHPGLIRKHGKADGVATFAMNQRVGYRANPKPYHGPGTFLQAQMQSRTLFMTGGVFKPGYLADTAFPEVIWPTGTAEAGTFPEADPSGKVALQFLDGHIEIRSVESIPRNENFNTENRVFWRGTLTGF
jgi:prepilin-type N-terminal cleavage/methylation domain-containing protein